MTREQLNELNALVAESDALTAALANLEAGGLLFNAGIGPSAEFVAPTPMGMPPMAPMGMASAVTVPVRGDIPASLMTELTTYLTARKAAVDGQLAASGATADPASAGGQQAAPQRPQQPPQGMQRPGQPQQQPQPQRR